MCSVNTTVFRVYVTQTLLLVHKFLIKFGHGYCLYLSYLKQSIVMKEVNKTSSCVQHKFESFVF